MTWRLSSLTNGSAPRSWRTFPSSTGLKLHSQTPIRSRAARLSRKILTRRTTVATPHSPLAAHPNGDRSPYGGLSSSTERSKCTHALRSCGLWSALTFRTARKMRYASSVPPVTLLPRKSSKYSGDTNTSLSNSHNSLRHQRAGGHAHFRLVYCLDFIVRPPGDCRLWWLSSF